MPADAREVRSILRAALALAAIATTVVLILALLADATRERISRNERAWFQARLDELVPAQSYDNDLLNDCIFLTEPDVFGTRAPVAVYRARRGGKPVAAVLTPTAPDGYGGPIRLMVAVRADGTLLGVAVLEHHETPGLGDVFESSRRDWLPAFAGHSLGDPPLDAWKVRRDGGQFDQFTGATITPRAIVAAVRRTLEYFERRKTAIFASQS